MTPLPLTGLGLTPEQVTALREREAAVSGIRARLADLERRTAREADRHRVELASLETERRSIQAACGHWDRAMTANPAGEIGGSVGYCTLCGKEWPKR